MTTTEPVQELTYEIKEAKTTDRETNVVIIVPQMFKECSNTPDLISSTILQLLLDKTKKISKIIIYCLESLHENLQKHFTQFLPCQIDNFIFYYPLEKLLIENVHVIDSLHEEKKGKDSKSDNDHTSHADKKVQGEFGNIFQQISDSINDFHFAADSNLMIFELGNDEVTGIGQKNTISYRNILKLITEWGPKNIVLFSNTRFGSVLANYVDFFNICEKYKGACEPKTLHDAVSFFNKLSTHSIQALNIIRFMNTQTIIDKVRELMNLKENAQITETIDFAIKLIDSFTAMEFVTVEQISNHLKLKETVPENRRACIVNDTRISLPFIVESKLQEHKINVVETLIAKIDQVFKYKLQKIDSVETLNQLKRIFSILKDNEDLKISEILELIAANKTTTKHATNVCRNLTEEDIIRLSRINSEAVSLVGIEHVLESDLNIAVIATSAFNEKSYSYPVNDPSTSVTSFGSVGVSALLHEIVSSKGTTLGEFLENIQQRIINSPIEVSNDEGVLKQIKQTPQISSTNNFLDTSIDSILPPKKVDSVVPTNMAINFCTPLISSPYIPPDDKEFFDVMKSLGFLYAFLGAPYFKQKDLSYESMNKTKTSDDLLPLESIEDSSDDLDLNLKADYTSESEGEGFERMIKYLESTGPTDETFSGNGKETVTQYYEIFNEELVKKGCPVYVPHVSGPDYRFYQNKNNFIYENSLGPMHVNFIKLDYFVATQTTFTKHLSDIMNNGVNAYDAMVSAWNRFEDTFLKKLQEGTYYK